MISEKLRKHLLKLAQARKGTHHSYETKLKISLSRKNKYKGSENPNWKGGKINSDDYIYIFSPNHPNCTKGGYVLEQRLIIEKIIKRHLLPSEIIHHLNGIKNDNRPENLVICQSFGKHYIKYHFHNRNNKGQFANQV